MIDFDQIQLQAQIFYSERGCLFQHIALFSMQTVKLGNRTPTNSKGELSKEGLARNTKY